MANFHTYSDMVNASSDQIRQYGSKSVAVTLRLLEKLIITFHHFCRLEQKMALQHQGDMILKVSQEVLPEQNDKKDVQHKTRPCGML